MAYKMPNEGRNSGGGGTGGKTNTGRCSGLRRADPGSNRADTVKTPKSKNPYPNGMS